MLLVRFKRIILLMGLSSVTIARFCSRCVSPTRIVCLVPLVPGDTVEGVREDHPCLASGN